VILVDTSVLLDVLQNDAQWADWSQRELEAASLTARLCINPVIYAELSIAFARIEALESVLGHASVRVEPIPHEALFLAGKAFMSYRRQRGPKSGVLPDFFIGAHAAVRGWPLLTRDTRRYRSYFPTVALRSPA
jgi:predicted nucleic acid-binding protein